MTLFYTGTNANVNLPGIRLMNKEIDPSQFSYQISEFALISALNALRFAQVSGGVDVIEV